MSDIFEKYDWEQGATIEDLINFVTSKTEIRCSELQRKFLWGYNRGGFVMDWLIEKGIVESDSPYVYRKVLLTKEEAMKLVPNPHP